MDHVTDTQIRPLAYYFLCWFLNLTYLLINFSTFFSSLFPSRPMSLFCWFPCRAILSESLLSLVWYKILYFVGLIFSGSKNFSYWSNQRKMFINSHVVIKNGVLWTKPDRWPKRIELSAYIISKYLNNTRRGWINSFNFLKLYYHLIKCYQVYSYQLTTKHKDSGTLASAIVT